MPHGSSSKNFCKFCKPLFTNQITNFDDKVMLVEIGKVVSKNEEVAYLFSIERWLTSNHFCKDPLVNAIRKDQIHASILKIKSVFKSIRLFNFNFVSSYDIYKIITSLDSTKKTSGVIPTKIVKLANKEICKDLANCINKSIKKNEFPNEMRAAGVTAIFKKDSPLNKENYRPVSVLQTIYNIFERVLFDQVTRFSNKLLSPLLCGFRKRYSTQYAFGSL